MTWKQIEINNMYIVISFCKEKLCMYLSGSINIKMLTMGQKKRNKKEKEIEKNESVSWMVDPPTPFSHSAPRSSPPKKGEPHKQKADDNIHQKRDYFRKQRVQKIILYDLKEWELKQLP